jgi:hypothetical protein
VGASIGQKGVHTLKTGRVDDETERSPPNGNRTAMLAQFR